MAVIGGFRSDLLITHKTDGNFGNVSVGALFSKVAYINENGGNPKQINITWLASCTCRMY